MRINKVGTARLYINGEYIADVSLDKADVFEEATKQYKEDENLGRLLWKLDGVKVDILTRAENKRMVVCCGYVHHGKTLSQLASVSYIFDEYISTDNFEEKHFLKYCNIRKGKKGRKFHISKKNY